MQGIKHIVNMGGGYSAWIDTGFAGNKPRTQNLQIPSLKFYTAFSMQMHIITSPFKINVIIGFLFLHK